ncbi:MAG TPA: hypothetical protein VF073_00700 [Gaiella sp.]
MSRDRDDVDAEIVLPAGMELVVPPAARPANPVAAAGDGKPDSHSPRARPPDGAAGKEPRRPPAA